MDFPLSMAMLKRVSLRLHLARWGMKTLLWTTVSGLVYLTLILSSRLSSYGTEFFPLWSVALVPAMGILLGLLAYRRPSLSDAARLVDQHQNTNDLFLTVARLDDAFGDYRPLVVQSAEQKAEHVKPTEVVPFMAGKQTAQFVVLVLILLITADKFPTFDLFGIAEAQEEINKQQELVDAEKKATNERKEKLKKHQAPEQQRSEEIKRTLSDLQKTFKSLKPKAKQENQKKLSEIQKPIGKMWRQLSSEQLSKSFKKKMSGQRFGKASERQMAEKWMQELKEGSTQSLTKKLDEMVKDMRKLAMSSDPGEKRKLRNQLLKKLKQVKEFAENDAKSQQLKTALERAMKQLETANMKEGDASEEEESEEAASESMQLAQMELEEIQQSLDDLKNLEEALKTLQQAKAKNAAGEGLSEEELEMLSQAEALAEYAEMFAQMSGGMGEGEGEGEGSGNGSGGTGGDGFGEGGQVEEDPDSKSEFKTEFSKSQLTKGKLLLSLQSKDVNESGEMKIKMGSLIDDLQQGVSEAIDQEQIPPGYHESIKKYFDTLKPSETAKPTETAAPQTDAPANETAPATKE